VASSDALATPVARAVLTFTSAPTCITLVARHYN